MLKILGVADPLRGLLLLLATTAIVGISPTFPPLLPVVSDTVCSVESVTLDDVAVDAMVNPTTAQITCMLSYGLLDKGPVSIA